MRSHPILCYAHRGAALEYPENTIAAFRRALELGADVIETDAHCTADEEVVLSHDATVRCADTHKTIRNSTLREVQQWDVGRGYHMPKLAEVLESFPNAQFNVDAKQHDIVMVRATLRTLRSLRAMDRVRIASFSSRTLAMFRAEGFVGRCGLGMRDVVALRMLPDVFLRRLSGDAAQLPTRQGPVSLCSATFVEKVHRLGLRLDYWTVNEPDDAERLLGLGADGIMTDDPARIVPIVDAFRRRQT